MDDKEKRKLLGQKIQRLRKQRNLTQDAFCEIIGIEPGSLSKIENGTFFPSLPNFIKMAEAFSIEPNDLLDVEYLREEDKLEEEMFRIIKIIPKEKKQLLYRFIKLFNE